MHCRLVLLTCALILPGPGTPGCADPVVAPQAKAAAPELGTARQRLRVAPGLQVGLWAGEPLVQNLTSLSFDDAGRAYVVETGRRRTSVFDIRNFKDWVHEDLALRTVEERSAYLSGMLATNADFRSAATKGGKGGFGDFTGDGVVDVRDLEVESERIRLVWDADRDGQADSATTFADGFSSSVSGVAAGVLAQGTNVWFTCIPDLWRFEAAAVPSGEWPRGEIAPMPPRDRERLLHGFGVHIAYGGHDMHGLIKGPDGRLYFTIADRGATVTNREGRVLSAPDAGSVFRCEPDGSQLEIFATGLRNPQELAFDELGNLWTGDNNGDGGDQARWTLVLEGADYGWTIGWQWLPKMGAWNSERLWHTRGSNTAVYLVPPVAHIGHGPAGIAYYPGTGLGDRFIGTFFMSDFPGGVRMFRVAPDGAFYRMAQEPGGDPVDPPGRAARAPWLQDNSSANMTGKLLWDLYPVDVTFPPDGGVVVADWVEGWEKTGKGRLWRVTDPALAGDPAIAATKRLLAEGMTHRKDNELAGLLADRDMRVRLNAQWELAARGGAAWGTLARVAASGSNPLPRLHALWGLGQITRTSGKALPAGGGIQLLSILDDADPEVRGQAARFFGQSDSFKVGKKLRPLISDSNPRLAMQGILAHADRIKGPARDAGELLPFDDLSARIVRDGLDDPALRHAEVMMIARAVVAFDPEGPGRSAFARFINHTHADVRLAYLLAERQLALPAIRRSLSDPDPRLVLEAARAIHDVPIPAAMPDLAALLQPEALNRLLRQANAVSTHVPKLPYSAEEWLTYVLRRAVNAAFRVGTETTTATLATLSVHPGIPEMVRVEAVEDLGLWAAPPPVDRVVGLHRPLPARDSAPALRALAVAWTKISRTSQTNLVLAALDTAATLQWSGLSDALAQLQQHPEAALRAEAKRRADLRAPVTFQEWVTRAESGPLPRRQDAFHALAESPDPLAAEVLEVWAGRLASGDVPPGLALDVLESVSRRIPGSPALAAWTNSWKPDDRLGAQRVTLEGGDDARGRRLFAERADWGCQRCHKLAGEGGEVGPDLTGMGRTRGREYVLQSILYPNDVIAPGFENVIVTRRDGSAIIGMVKAERPGELEVESPEDGRVLVRTADIQSRERGISAMPDGMSDLITPHELRDLVEALSQ